LDFNLLMKFFKITFDDGNSIKTGFNGTLEEVNNYYLNNSFELVEGTMSKAVKVEIID